MEQKTEASQALDGIPTWRERMAKAGLPYPGYKPDSYMEAEIADLRAALKAQPETQCSREAVISECVEELTTHLGRSSRVDVVERNAIFGCREVVAALKAQPAPTVALVPVKYEQRMVTPNGHTGPWSETQREMYERYSTNQDIGDGFKYEVRALYAAQPAPTEAAQVTVTVEQGGVYITKGVQSFRLAYEGETQAEKEWYAGQLRAALAQGEDSARLDALAIIRDLDKISMELGARLARMDITIIKGREYLYREDVMIAVTDWRSAWDKNSKARKPIDRARASAETGGVNP